ncbi:hypothetical protein LP109_08450 [Moraxella bovis]|nr:hypothetical protein [Moraxella bovis]UZA15698.1 hypothetical protein LP109_08450 [Moraxella bovis]
MMMGVVLGLCHAMSQKLGRASQGVFALCAVVSVIVMTGAWQMMNGVVMGW